MLHVGGMRQTSETSFEPDWLALREPADHAARDDGLLAQAAGLVSKGSTVLDLGSGTGSTARAFARAGFDGFAWRFLDNDPALLQNASTRHPDAVCVVQDLSYPEDIQFEGVSFVTASALLDVMTGAWMEALLARVAKANIPIYAALNYNGDMHWTPADTRDAQITMAFNTHQRSDKGLGPALGPDATATFARLCEAYGYRFHTAQSPWLLRPEDAALQTALLSGIAEAAHEAYAVDAPQWAQARHAVVAQTQAFIGHTDILAIPT